MNSYLAREKIKRSEDHDFYRAVSIRVWSESFASAAKEQIADRLAWEREGLTSIDNVY